MDRSKLELRCFVLPKSFADAHGVPEGFRVQPSTSQSRPSHTCFPSASRFESNLAWSALFGLTLFHISRDSPVDNEAGQSVRSKTQLISDLIRPSSSFDASAPSRCPCGQSIFLCREDPTVGQRARIRQSVLSHAQIGQTVQRIRNLICERHVFERDTRIWRPKE